MMNSCSVSSFHMPSYNLVVGSEKQNSNLGCCGLWYGWKELLWSSSTSCLISEVFHFKKYKNKIKFLGDMQFPSKAIWVTSLKSLSRYATCFLIEFCQIVVTLSEIHFIHPWPRSRTRPLPHATLLHWKLATYPLILPPNKNSMPLYDISLS